MAELDKKETTEEREERKANYVSLVLSKNQGGADEVELRKEAEEKFEKENSIE